MLKRTALIILAASIFASPAAAHTGGSLTFKHSGPQHTFTLKAARKLDVRSYHHGGIPVRITNCGWKSVHVAACLGSLTVAVIDGQAPVTYILTDYITRSGPCPIHRDQRTGLYSGVSHGDSRNCFTGPLVVIPAGLRMQSDHAL